MNSTFSFFPPKKPRDCLLSAIPGKFEDVLIYRGADRLRALSSCLTVVETSHSLLFRSLCIISAISELSVTFPRLSSEIRLANIHTGKHEYSSGNESMRFNLHKKSLRGHGFQHFWKPFSSFVDWICYVVVMALKEKLERIIKQMDLEHLSYRKQKTVS